MIIRAQTVAHLARRSHFLAKRSIVERRHRTQLMTGHHYDYEFNITFFMIWTGHNTSPVLSC